MSFSCAVYFPTDSFAGADQANLALQNVGLVVEARILIKER
jgi:hypothetical protein